MITYVHMMQQCAEEGKVWRLKLDVPTGKLALAASLDSDGSGSLAVVYPW